MLREPWSFSFAARGEVRSSLFEQPRATRDQDQDQDQARKAESRVFGEESESACACALPRTF
jgi:hypothetical protein